MFNDFYEYRAEIRKKLGRALLYPEKSNTYMQEVQNIFRENKAFTETYFDNLTINEKYALESLVPDVTCPVIHI